MEFEWDEDKRTEILSERSLDILDAAQMFETPERVLEWRDDRRDYGEARFIAVGPTSLGYRQIVYTWRGAVMRLITCWQISEEQYVKYKASYVRATKGDEKTG